MEVPGTPQTYRAEWNVTLGAIAIPAIKFALLCYFIRKREKTARSPGKNTNCLDLNQLAETTSGGANGSRSSGGQGPGTTSHGLLAATALPDTDSLTFDSVLFRRGSNWDRC
jgi:hypothetical protein